MKKIVTLILLSIILLTNMAMTTLPVNIYIDGEKIDSDVEPFITEGRTMVPLRVISEYLGYEVEWDEKDQLISIYEYEDQEKTQLVRVAFLMIDNPEIAIYSKEYFDLLTSEQSTISEEEIMRNTGKKIDVSPMLHNSRTMVPLRAIAEIFGKNVEWNEDTFTVTIN